MWQLVQIPIDLHTQILSFSFPQCYFNNPPPPLPLDRACIDCVPTEGLVFHITSEILFCWIPLWLQFLWLDIGCFHACCLPLPPPSAGLLTLLTLNGPNLAYTSCGPLTCDPCTLFSLSITKVMSLI